MSNLTSDSKPRLDKWDYIIATSSGIITAGMDVLWVKDISLTESRKWGIDETNNFVEEIARKKGFKGVKNDTAGAVKYLEDLYPISADKLTNDFGGGRQHHLRDFSHHPTVVGLMFSILSQFTGMGYGTDVYGNFQSYPIPDSTIADGISDRIYTGTVQWVFHMISDIAGSSSSLAMGKEGTGLPGPLMSFLKELSSVPGIKALAGKDKDGHYQFSKNCSKLFNGTLLGEHDGKNIIKGSELKFDLRTEIGIGHEMIENKQYLPVLINDLIVRAFYSVRRFITYIKNHPIEFVDDIKSIDVTVFMPWKSDQLTHMLMVSSASFSVIDITAAGIKAAIKNKDNKTGFALDFIQGINCFGIGKLTLAIGGEAVIGIEKLKVEFLELVDKQLTRIDLNREELNDMITDTASKVGAIAGIGTPVGFVGAAVSVYKEISKALDEYQLAREECVSIRQQCTVNISLLRENRARIEAAVSEYMYSNLSVFSSALGDMSAALSENNTDAFISGNNKIQRQLGNSDSFSSRSEFDSIMNSDDNFKL